MYLQLFRKFSYILPLLFNGLVRHHQLHSQLLSISFGSGELVLKMMHLPFLFLVCEIESFQLIELIIIVFGKRFLLLGKLLIFIVSFSQLFTLLAYNIIKLLYLGYLRLNCLRSLQVVMLKMF